MIFDYFVFRTVYIQNLFSGVNPCIARSVLGSVDTVYCSMHAQRVTGQVHVDNITD